MLFNSPEFIFVFLPASLVTFLIVERFVSPLWAIFSLGVFSIFFYGWWDFRLVWVILASIAMNFTISRLIQGSEAPVSFWLAVTGVSLNLGLLFYFKYAYFVAGLLSGTAGLEYSSTNIVLPIGISFFTFQQIAYLADTYGGKCRERSFRAYLLFVSFFPQLIAGPIVHHSEMMPQFHRRRLDPVSVNLAIGLTIFVIGLSKKMLLADTFALIATPTFDAAADGRGIDFWQAWIATLAYTLQIYFDFSGYSDMAIGIGRMFGIQLPINFASPYKATSLIDFWRRWHITLSRFLRDYLYIPLGGNRKGRGRTYTNIAVTMLLGGLWHGASWTFILWGAIHGAGLLVNHIWGRFKIRIPLAKPVGWLLTFALIVVAWVLFRADSLAAAGRMYSSMFGANGILVSTFLAPFMEPYAEFFQALGIQALGVTSIDRHNLPKLLGGVLLVLLAPNTQTIMRNFTPGFRSHHYPDPTERAPAVRLTWSYSAGYATFFGFLFALCVARLTDVSEFIYFQF